MAAKTSIPPPNYTQTPNLVFDLAKDMSAAELRVTLAIARETFGYHRKQVKLTVGDLVEATKLSRRAVISGTAEGEKRGTILRESCTENNLGIYVYMLNVDPDNQCKKVTGYLNAPVQKSNTTGAKKSPVLYKEDVKESIKESTMSPDGDESSLFTGELPNASPHTNGLPDHTSAVDAVRAVSSVRSRCGVEQIYALYPRKVAPAAAKKAIARALAKCRDRGDPIAFLTERVTAYAKAREGQDKQFTPHPATWFNQERYLDDDAEWQVHQNGSNGQNGRRTVTVTKGAMGEKYG